MRTTYPAAQHDKNKNDMTRKPRRTKKCNEFLAQLRMTRSVRGERANLKGLVLGCIEAKFCKCICVGIAICLEKKIKKKGHGKKLKNENLDK